MASKLGKRAHSVTLEKTTVLQSLNASTFDSSTQASKKVKLGNAEREPTKEPSKYASYTKWLIKNEPPYDAAWLAAQSNQTGMYDGVRNHEVKKMIDECVREGHEAIYYYTDKKTPQDKSRKIAPPSTIARVEIACDPFPCPLAVDKTSEYYDSSTENGPNQWRAFQIKLKDSENWSISLASLKHFSRSTLSSTFWAQTFRLRNLIANSGVVKNFSIPIRPDDSTCDFSQEFYENFDAVKSKELLDNLMITFPFRLSYIVGLPESEYKKHYLDQKRELTIPAENYLSVSILDLDAPLGNLMTLRRGRLSVSPISDLEWDVMSILAACMHSTILNPPQK